MGIVDSITGGIIWIAETIRALGLAFVSFASANPLAAVVLLIIPLSTLVYLDFTEQISLSSMISGKWEESYDYILDYSHEVQNETVNETIYDLVFVNLTIPEYSNRQEFYVEDGIKGQVLTESRCQEWAYTDSSRVWERRFYFPSGTMETLNNLWYQGSKVLSCGVMGAIQHDQYDAVCGDEFPDIDYHEVCGYATIDSTTAISGNTMGEKIATIRGNASNICDDSVSIIDDIDSMTYERYFNLEGCYVIMLNSTHERVFYNNPYVCDKYLGVAPVWGCSEDEIFQFVTLVLNDDRVFTESFVGGKPDRVLDVEVGLLTPLNAFNYLIRDFVIGTADTIVEPLAGVFGIDLSLVGIYDNFVRWAQVMILGLIGLIGGAMILKLGGIK